MDLPRDSGLSASGPSNASWWPSSFEDNLHSVSSISSHDDNLFLKETAADPDHGGSSPYSASQILWASGSLSGPIPNGFFSVMPDKRLAEIFDKIPSPDDIRSLGIEGVRADIILVDSEKDKKLSMLKQLVVALVKGPKLNLASVIKKIAGLVSDVYRRPNSDLSPAKSVVEEMGNIVENRFQLLGQIKHGSCRPQAILFKVLADTVGLKCKLMVGIPGDGPTECVDSHRHMSVVVLLNSVEMLVDLMRFPGKLMPFSTKAVFTSRISAAGESDSAKNDSCDSPLEPNSPLFGLSDKLDTDSLSHRDPNSANTFWRRSRQKAVAEQRTASSSPEHPLFRVRGRSILSGGRHSFREYGDRVIASRSDGASSPDSRRIRRRSISFTPEISDDIVSAVRAMNETLKQNRPLKDRGDETSYSYGAGGKNDESSFHTDEAAAGRSAFDFSRKQIISSQKAMSLPSSSHEVRGQISDRGEISSSLQHGDLLATWNKVLQSSSVLTKPLLPFEEWNIDFSELTVGTRIGIGFFGEVFRGMLNGTDVAIKVFLEQDLTAENMEDFCNEIMIMSRLRHPNVILFLGACTEPPRLSMVTEYMGMGSLYYLIHSNDNKKRLTWRRRLKMLQDICRGLMCMHGKQMVHRDLKSANCLVNKHWIVKICDFGLSRVMTENPMRDSSSAGTPEWMAPELIRNEPFTEKCDIFSLGVIMWELCTLGRPWEGVPLIQVVYAVANEGSRLDIPEGPLGKLISDCWAEPDERPSCKEILARLLDCEYTLC